MHKRQSGLPPATQARQPYSVDCSLSIVLPVLVCRSVTDAAAPRPRELDHLLDAVQAAPTRTEG